MRDLSENLRGALWMTAAMAGFAVEDLALKLLARGLPVGQILILFGMAGALCFALLARAQGQRVLHPAVLSRAMLVRAGFEVAGRLFYLLAIALTPLASASAILQATPLLVVAGAAVLFGEPVGWRRWSAVLFGFAGVLVILRPGIEGFSALSLLAVAGLIGFAGRDLATRAAPPVLGSLTLGVYGFAAMVPAGMVMLALGGAPVWPSRPEVALLAAATVVGVAAYFALTRAMRTGEVGAVTPFRYTRLVFALILAVAYLGERPDAPTLIGAAMIVASGLYALARANRANRAKDKPLST
jgi:drug/metabolite transporter (DMT)-like permease